MAIKNQSTLWLKCSDIIRETADVKTFKFTSSEASLKIFQPGQFIRIHCKIDGIDQARCYTLSSCPTTDNQLEIVVKAVTGGKVSNWLLDHFNIGDTLQVTPPNGRFFFSQENRKKLLLLSAGSGITPMLSIAKHIAHQGLNYDIIFHHSTRSANDLIQANQLDQLAQRLKNFKLTYNFTREPSPSQSSIKALRGRFSADMLNQICEDVSDRDTFVCGPTGFMSATKALLINAGLPSEQYFEESFALDPLLEDDTQSAQHYQIEFQYSAQQVTINGNQTVLDAVQQAGIELDISCTSGACGSCNSYLIDGEIHAPQAQAITSKDRANGEFLPCCSFARSNLVIDL